MTVFRASLYGQAAWFLTASLYNLLSLLSIADGEQGFAGDAATTQSAMAVVAVFGVVTLTGVFGRMTIYKIMAPIVVIVLFVGGVIKHVNLGPTDYASEMSWMLAILINSFGVIAYSVGAVTAFWKT